MIVNQQYYICMNEQIFALLNTKYALNWCLFNNYCILHILYKINLNYLCRRDSLFTTLTRNYRKFQTKNFQAWEVEHSGPPCLLACIILTSPFVVHRHDSPHFFLTKGALLEVCDQGFTLFHPTV
jgi:hypothetical protein